MNKIYTKTGDKGFTSLIGGTRIPKNDLRLDAYGTVDELNSFLGLLRSYLENDSLSSEILAIQNFLFEIGAFLATDMSKQHSTLPGKIVNAKVEFFESRIDAMHLELPVLKNFIIPGGSMAVSTCHVCRTVCRRLERRIYDLHDIDDFSSVLVYVNRLSDYLFVLARYISHSRGEQEILRD